MLDKLKPDETGVVAGGGTVFNETPGICVICADPHDGEHPGVFGTPQGTKQVFGPVCGIICGVIVGSQD